MKQVNPEHIKELLELLNSGPYLGLLGIKISDFGIGYSKVELELQRKHLNPFGGTHGGVYASVIDVAAYMAVYCELDEHAGATSLDLSINNLSMIREGKIIIEGKSIKIGQHICLAEALAKDEHGKMLAHGTSKIMVLDGKQSMNHAIKAMGHRTLPPKFIG